MLFPKRTGLACGTEGSYQEHHQARPYGQRSLLTQPQALHYKCLSIYLTCLSIQHSSECCLSPSRCIAILFFSLRENNVELAQEVIKSDDEVDRFSFYIVQQLKIAIKNEYLLKEIGLEEPRNCLGYRLIKSVERVATMQ